MIIDGLCDCYEIRTYEQSKVVHFWHIVNAIETYINRPLTISHGTDLTAQYEGLNVAVWLRSDGTLVIFPE
jgi:alpha-galactosidase/6-phospho-beta-glucosidase family protein